MRVLCALSTTAFVWNRVYTRFFEYVTYDRLYTMIISGREASSSVGPVLDRDVTSYTRYTKQRAESRPINVTRGRFNLRTPFLPFFY